MGCLYMLEFAGGKRYIGITERKFHVRFLKHRVSASNGSPLAVHAAWRKYGEPKARVLAHATGAFLLDLEKRAIAAYSTVSPAGYNLTLGGDTPCSHLPEVRAKIAASNTGKKWSAATRELFVRLKTGTKMSAETRAKMSASAKKACADPAIRAKKGTFKGRKHSPETRARMSAIRFAMMTPELREKLSAARRAVVERKALAAAL